MTEGKRNALAPTQFSWNTDRQTAKRRHYIYKKNIIIKINNIIDK